jgi:hypothetical protein
MNSTKDISAASDITNVLSFSGLSLEKQLSASVTAFSSNLYEHVTPNAFINSMISHAIRSAGIRLTDNLTAFGLQYNIPSDIADMLPQSFLPIGPNTKPDRNIPDWFNTPSCKAALRKVNGPRNVWSNPDEATGGGEAIPPPALTFFSEEKISKTHPPFMQRPEPTSKEEREDQRARTDEAFLLYGPDLSLIDGNSLLRGLLSARGGESEIIIAGRLATLQPPVLRIVGTLLKQPWVDLPDDAETDSAFERWRLGLIPTAIYFLMMASRALPVVPLAEGIKPSLHNASAWISRRNLVQDLQRRFAILHGAFPAFLNRMRADASLHIPLVFASVEYLPC